VPYPLGEAHPLNVFETHVLQIIGENTTSPDVFADTDTGIKPVRDSINDAIEEISMLTASYKEIYRIPLRQGQQFYRIRFTEGYFGWITNAVSMNKQYRLDSASIASISYEDPRFMVPTGTPEQYFQVGLDVVGFYPRPSGNSDIIEIHAVTIPRRYTNEKDRIKLRDSWKWAVVHYAVGEYYAGRGDAMEAKMHHDKYLDLLGIREVQPEQNERVYNMV